MKKGIILCVDDERVVLSALQTQLGNEFSEDFIIEIAESGDEAISIIQESIESKTEIPILISDEIMPGIKGHELLIEALKISPKTYSLLLTGHSDINAITQALNHGNLYRYISKPWEGTDLILTIREALRSYAKDKKLEEQNLLLKENNEKLEIKVAERTSSLEKLLTELKRTQSHLIQSEKMAALGTLVSGVAHEINNPLNFVSTNIFTLKSDLEELQDYLYPQLELEKNLKLKSEYDDKFIRYADIIADIEEGSSRIKAIVLDLRQFSHHDETELKRTNLAHDIETCIRIVKTQFNHEIEFVSELESETEIECRPGQLNQVFSNLLVNAGHAILEKMKKDKSFSKGQIKVKSFLEKGVGYVIEFNDNGIGMNEKVKEKIYEPFFTTKAVGVGTGMGMAISFSIIENHKGKIIIESTEGIGSKIKIILPL